MRYRLPDGTSAISVGTYEFIADEDGCIEVGDDVPAHVIGQLHNPNLHNLTPLPAEEPAAEADDAPVTGDPTVTGETVPPKPKRKR